MTQGNSTRNQYLATLAVNILSFSYGLFVGWLSPAIARLTSPATAMETGPVSNDDISWIGASLCIGGLVGNFVYGWMNKKKLGRKSCLLITSVPLFLSWTAVVFGKRVIHLCIARFLGGFAGSGVFFIVPVYVTEISQDKIRGALGSYFMLAVNLGILIAFVCGTYMTYRTNPYMLSVPVLVFTLIFAFIPETPQHLLKVKGERKAHKSYLFYRNYKHLNNEVSQQFYSEMQCLKENPADAEKNANGGENDFNEQLQMSDFTNKVARKSIIISMVLMFLSQFCGAFAMNNYTALIFYESGSSMPPELAAMVVAGIQVIGSYFSTVLIERYGRKILLLISAFGCAAGTFALGFYTLLKSYGVNMEGYEWIPIFSLSFVIFIAAWGVLALHFLVMSEIVPPKIINVISPICVAALFFFGFLTVKGLPVFNELFGLHASMFVFAVCSFLGGIFIIFYLPETKGKSINEIMYILSE